MAIRQWVVFRENPLDLAVRRLLRTEANMTGRSMSSIMREALMVRYRSQSEEVEASRWMAAELGQVAEETRSAMELVADSDDRPGY